jgi:hypothetical protein
VVYSDVELDTEEVGIGLFVPGGVLVRAVFVKEEASVPLVKKGLSALLVMKEAVLLLARSLMYCFWKSFA